MDTFSIRVLVVDDYEHWRHFILSELQKEPDLQVIEEAADGLEAVQKATELQPDLVLLDIGLPTLNGIEAARQIRKASPACKLLFVSENRSVDIAQEALSTGARGYVVKSDAASDLLPAIKAVLDGKQFVSANMAAHGPNAPADPQTGARFLRQNSPTPIPKNVGSARHHEVAFYADDRHFLEDVTRFIGTALQAGNSAIVIATESHRERLLLELKAYGLDIGAAIEQGRYIPLDAADALSMFMVTGMPDPLRFAEFLGGHAMRAMKASKGQPPRLSIFGECVRLLCEQGNVDAAIQMEKLGNKLAQIYDVDILCGYFLVSVESAMDNQAFQQICAEHSAVRSRGR